MKQWFSQNETKWREMVQFNETDVWWRFARSTLMSYLYDVFQPIWSPPNCVMSAYLMMSAQLCDVSSTVWCLPPCMKSAQMYDVCSTVRCLPTCMMSDYQYDVCSTVWCLLYWMMSAYLYYFFLPVMSATVRFLSTSTMSSYQYDVCPPV